MNDDLEVIERIESVENTQETPPKDIDNQDKIDVVAVISGQEVVEIPKDLYIPPDALEVILEAFEGPLDLLLYLIRKQDLDILNIPIADITKQYLRYIKLFLAETDGSVTLHTEMESKETFLSYAEDKSQGFSKIITDYVFPPMEE